MLSPNLERLASKAGLSVFRTTKGIFNMNETPKAVLHGNREIAANKELWETSFNPVLTSLARCR